MIISSRRKSTNTLFIASSGSVRYIHSMHQVINERVSVQLVYNHKKDQSLPSQVNWRGRNYLIEKLGMHYKSRRGKEMIHIFTCVTSTLYFKLLLESETLRWYVEEIYTE